MQMGGKGPLLFDLLTRSRDTGDQWKRTRPPNVCHHKTCRLFTKAVKIPIF